MAMTCQTSVSLAEVEDSMQAVLSPATTPSPVSNESQKFRAVFEEHMPSSRKPIKHESTSVLLLSYDSTDTTLTDMNVHEEIQKLDDVLQNDYGFYVEQQIIGRKRTAQLQMHVHLSNFALEHGKNHSLLVIYYAGHGWRNIVRSRHNPGSFDLCPRREYPGRSSEEELVMWEVSEAILHHVEGDVLVIFDCCDAGSLAALRSSGRAFEYLGACDELSYTHPPGEQSFTSALTWALKNMRSEPSFTTADLLAKIKTHEKFPAKQNPVLFTRSGFIPENIWISSMRKVALPTTSRRRSNPAPEFRDDNCHFVDVRITFSRTLADEDGKAVAEMMGPLVRNKKLPLNARHVLFLDKGVCKSRRSAIENWNRISRHLRATQRFQRPLSTSDTRPNKKRERAVFDSEIGDNGARKYAKSSIAVEVEPIDQLPITPSSEDRDRIPSLRIDTALESTLTMDNPQERLGTAYPSQVGILLRDLEKLKQNALQKPQLQQFFHSQIRLMLEDSEEAGGLD